MLVGYYNTNDPVTIILLAVAYCWKTCVLVIGGGRGRGRMDWSTFGLGCGLIVLSVCLLLANAVGGVLVPGNLRLGHVARVNPDAIFLPLTDPQMLLVPQFWQRFQSPTAFRAMSDLVQMKDALKDKYNMSSTPTGTDPRQPGLNFTYRYVVTGLDFGFQRAPELTYTASGSCVTRYDWFNATSSDDTQETYTITDWPELGPQDFSVANRTSVPTAIYYLVPTEADERSFLMIPQTANRESPNENLADPWYMTGETIPNRVRLKYRVAGARPVVHCKQIDTYEFRGKSVSNVMHLSQLFGGANSKLSQFWWDTVIPHELGPGVMGRIGNVLGANSLASSLQYVDYDASIDLAEASLTKDLERLVLGSLVYTREIVRSTTMTTAEQRGNYTNRAALNSTNGKVLDEFADFVISSPEVTTMSVWVLIVTPSVCLFIWAFIAIKSTFLFTEHWGNICNDSWRARYVQRTVLFSAIQLYRLLDEEVSGERRWKGRLSFYPYVSDVSRKYVRRFSEFEVVPTSARKSDAPPAPYSPSPSPPPPKTGRRADTMPSYDPSPGAEDISGGGTDSSRPLVTPFVRPAFVPLHERRSSDTTPSYTGRNGDGSRSSFSADRRRPTSEYAPSTDKYELVMTRHWRPNLNEGEMIHWRQVQDE